VTVVARRACASSREAERLAAAVAADNPDYVRVRAEGRELVVRVRARSAASARASLDDLFAAFLAAERTGATAAPARRPAGD